MTDTTTPLTSTTWDAVVVGGGIAGLTAAWELTRSGLRPLVVEARGYVGGLVAGASIGGAVMDLGAESFVARGHAVTEIVEALGMDLCPPGGGSAHLFLPPLAQAGSVEDGSAQGGTTEAGTAGAAQQWQAHRFIRDSFLGIPSQPLADDVVAVLGREGAERAAADMHLGADAGTGADDPEDFASFVRCRMGEAVLDRLVRPIVAGIYTADPSTLSTDAVAPGLREATARTGSLHVAVAQMLERRRAQVQRAADISVWGGMHEFISRLRQAIEAAGGCVHTRLGAQQLRPATGADLVPPPADSGASPQLALWELEVAPTGRGPRPSDEPIPVGPHEVVRTRRLILACSAGAAQRLLAQVQVEAQVDFPPGSAIARVMLVLRDCPTLDAAPLGSGILVAPSHDDVHDASTLGATAPTRLTNPDGSTGITTAPTPPHPDEPASAPPPCPVRAKALSHLSVKWPWVGEQLRAAHGPHTHALRLSYGDTGLDENGQVSTAQALADASTLLGLSPALTPEQLIEQRTIHWDGTLPPTTPFIRAHTARIVDDVAAHPGLAVTGAWVAGTGIAAVVAHARAQAARLSDLDANPDASIPCNDPTRAGKE